MKERFSTGLYSISHPHHLLWGFAILCVCRGGLRFNRVCVRVRASGRGAFCILMRSAKATSGQKPDTKYLAMPEAVRKRRKVLLQKPQNPIKKRSWSLRVLPTLTFEDFTKPCTWRATPKARASRARHIPQPHQLLTKSSLRLPHVFHFSEIPSLVPVAVL